MKAIPSPNVMSSPGPRTSPTNVPSGRIPDSHHIPTAAAKAPPINSGLGPRRGTVRAAIWAPMMIITTIGRNRTPVFSGLNPRTVCM